MGNLVHLRRVSFAHLPGQRAQPLRVELLAAKLRQSGPFFYELRPLQRLALEIRLRRFKLRLELMLPRPKSVAPRFHRVLVHAVGKECADASPPVISIRYRQHRRLVPARLALLAPLQQRRDQVVPVLEDIRLHQQILAHRALDRVPAPVKQRIDVLDNNGWRMKRHGHVEKRIAFAPHLAAPPEGNPRSPENDQLSALAVSDSLF